ncbi:MAG: hypothetical protein Kow0042_16120 [Calditrichia bacterium]
MLWKGIIRKRLTAAADGKILTGTLLSICLLFTGLLRAEEFNPPNLLPRTPSSELESRVAQIFEQNCTSAGCHSGTYPQMGLKLTSDAYYSTAVNQPSVEKPELMRIKPGNPDSSYMVMKILGVEGIIGLPMPFGRETLTQEEISTIIEWIKGMTTVDTLRTAPPLTIPKLPFNGWKVVNLPTTRMVDKGQWLFLIGHRFFPKLKDGYDAFYGLDGSAAIFLNLGYAFTDKFYLNLGRSNLSDNVEMDIKYQLKQQLPEDKLPVALALYGAVNWLSEKQPGKDRLRSEAFKYSIQGIIAHQPAEGFGLLIAPGVLFNPNSQIEKEDPLITLGLGARTHLYKSLHLVGEWTPILTGYTPTTTFGEYNRFDSWAGGLEIFVGGHVFQIILTNSAGLTTDQYMRGGDLDIRDGDLRLGFNIFRMLQF